jgi:hypothetical protein
MTCLRAGSDPNLGRRGRMSRIPRFHSRNGDKATCLSFTAHGTEGSIISMTAAMPAGFPADSATIAHDRNNSHALRQTRERNRVYPRGPGGSSGRERPERDGRGQGQ